MDAGSIESTGRRAARPMNEGSTRVEAAALAAAEGGRDMSRRILRARAALATAMALGAFTAAGPASAADEGPRKEMHAVYEAIAHLLPLAMNEEAWAYAGNAENISKWLDALSSRTGALEAHSESRDAGFRHLSRSLSADVAEIRSRRALGRFEESRFFMIQTTSTCVACHSRLPSNRSFPLGDKLMRSVETEALSPHERIQILVATRQFDASLDEWEKLFRDKSVSPSLLDLDGYLLDYLTIAIRVQRQLDRVVKTLRTFANRGDVPTYLARHIEGWIRTLKRVGPALEDPKRLERARELVTGADGRFGSPLGREGIVVDLIASSILLQLIDSGTGSPAEQAEAFYLLGVAESRSVDSYWVPQAEYHLEIAIRMAPDAAFAEDAYAALEEYVVLGYGGSSGEALPADVWARLRELRELLDAQVKSGT
jgi:hypothetical protein